MRILRVSRLELHNESIKSIEHRPNAVQQKTERIIEPVINRDQDSLIIVINITSIKGFKNLAIVYACVHA
jgi:hypothetical protein